MNVLFDNFEMLVDTPGGVDKLRKLVLRLAVQGKLVKQDPDDEPAFFLLKRMECKRQGKDLGTNAENETSKQEDPRIPGTWCLANLPEVAKIVGGGTPRTNIPEYYADNDGIPWLTPKDLYRFKGKYISHGRKFITPTGLEKSSAQLLPEGTVLFSSRAPIGYVAIARNELTTNQGFKSCVPYEPEMSEYIYYFLRSAAAEIDGNASGTTFREISGKGMSRIKITVPPLEEQKRIVDKVDKLMVLCDKLTSDLKKRSTISEKLFDALVNKATTQKSRR